MPVTLASRMRRNDVRAWRAIENRRLGCHSTEQRTVMLTDLDISLQRLDLAQLIGGDRNAALPSTNEVKVHGAPILYKKIAFHSEASHGKPSDEWSYAGQTHQELEEQAKPLGLPVHDHQLTGDIGHADPRFCRGVADIRCLEVEAVERPPDVRVVVDADHHPPLGAPHEVGHTLVLLGWKVDAVAVGLPVRWVHVEERVCSIIALGTIEPGQVFDVGASQALPGGREVLIDAHHLGSCFSLRLSTSPDTI